MNLYFSINTRVRVNNLKQNVNNKPYLSNVFNAYRHPFIKSNSLSFVIDTDKLINDTLFAFLKYIKRVKMPDRHHIAHLTVMLIYFVYLLVKSPMNVSN